MKLVIFPLEFRLYRIDSLLRELFNKILVLLTAIAGISARITICEASLGIPFAAFATAILKGQELVRWVRENFNRSISYVFIFYTIILVLRISRGKKEQHGSKTVILTIRYFPTIHFSALTDRNQLNRKCRPPYPGTTTQIRGSRR
jgi:hypothetical protein